MKHSIIHYSKSILHAAGRLVRNQRFCMILVLCVCTLAAFADDAGTSAGINALNSAKTSIVAYLPYVKNLCYAIAAVVAVVGAISVYIKMNKEYHDDCGCLRLPDCCR